MAFVVKMCCRVWSGVFFRMETLRVTKRIGVTGWVRNLPDGRVETVIEGPGEKVEEMLKWCEKGPPLARVTEVERMEEKSLSSFTEFSIR